MADPTATDLVVRLQATLEEIAKLAEPELDGQGQDGSWHTRHCGYVQGEWQEPCECDVPDTILRLVQAHRDILDDYEHARQVSDRLIERDCEVGTRVVQQRAVNALERVVAALARGYGLEVKP